jgi:hypothetical protein
MVRLFSISAGCVNDRQTTYKYLDDAYNPAQTVPLTKSRASISRDLNDLQLVLLVNWLDQYIADVPSGLDSIQAWAPRASRLLSSGRPDPLATDRWHCRTGCWGVLGDRFGASVAVVAGVLGA